MKIFENQLLVASLQIIIFIYMVGVQNVEKLCICEFIKIHEENLMKKERKIKDPLFSTCVSNNSLFPLLIRIINQNYVDVFPFKQLNCTITLLKKK